MQAEQETLPTKERLVFACKALGYGAIAASCGDIVINALALK